MAVKTHTLTTLRRFHQEIDELARECDQIASEYGIPEGLENGRGKFPYMPLDDAVIEARRIGIEPADLMRTYANALTQQAEEFAGDLASNGQAYTSRRVYGLAIKMKRNIFSASICTALRPSEDL